MIKLDNEIRFFFLRILISNELSDKNEYEIISIWLETSVDIFCL